MRAMLLCAGLGTRLGSMTDRRPKPMLPVCGISILRYALANLAAHGITELVINTHHLGDVIRDELGDGRAAGVHIQYIHEDALLGTGGGLKHALPLLDPDGRDEPFISLNGKLIVDIDLAAMAAAYRLTAAADPALLGMMLVRRVPDARAWGAVQVRGGRITDILGDGEHMFCGIHITRPSVMARLPDGEADSIRQGYLPWLRAGGHVAAHELPPDRYFAEHSTPERYLASSWALLDGQTLRHPPGALRGIDPSARIDPSAVIREPVRICAGAEIGPGITVGPHAVVGERARVTRSIADTVVWAGATADAATAGQNIIV